MTECSSSTVNVFKVEQYFRRLHNWATEENHRSGSSRAAKKIFNVSKGGSVDSTDKKEQLSRVESRRRHSCCRRFQERVGWWYLAPGSLNRIPLLMLDIARIQLLLSERHSENSLVCLGPCLRFLSKQEALQTFYWVYNLLAECSAAVTGGQRESKMPPSIIPYSSLLIFFYTHYVFLPSFWYPCLFFLFL